VRRWQLAGAALATGRCGAGNRPVWRRQLANAAPHQPPFRVLFSAEPGREF